MRWQDGRRSSNIEDRRNEEPVGGGGGLLAILPLLFTLGRSKGGRVIIAVAVLVALATGSDLSGLLGNGTRTVASQQSTLLSPAEQQLTEFVAVVLADTEDTWSALFRQQNRQYQEPTLVLFSGSISSACGLGQAAMGPFYCPADQKVYIDLSFYQDLRKRFLAPGDFAQAYVIAHEIGHHVQNLLGISGKVQRARQGLSETASNQLSVRLELQADCLAGVWAQHAQRTRNILEPGDLAEALNAASAIGDDRLQQQTRGQVTPDSFTHGTSAQRQRWFSTGFEQGSIASCNTFADNVRL